MSAKKEDVNEMSNKIKTYLQQNKTKYKIKYRGSSKGIFEVMVDDNLRSLFIELIKIGKFVNVGVYGNVSNDITKITPELTQFLIEKNNEIMGSLFIHKEYNCIQYRYVLLGRSLNAEKLFTVISDVYSVIEAFEEKISKMSGGKRLIDVIREDVNKK